jgi:hypothetical protein
MKWPSKLAPKQVTTKRYTEKDSKATERRKLHWKNSKANDNGKLNWNDSKTTDNQKLHWNDPKTTDNRKLNWKESKATDNQKLQWKDSKATDNRRLHWTTTRQGDKERKCVKVLFCIQKVSDSNLDQESCWRIFKVSLSFQPNTGTVQLHPSWLTLRSWHLCFAKPCYINWIQLQDTQA